MPHYVTYEKLIRFLSRLDSFKGLLHSSSRDGGLAEPFDNVLGFQKALKEIQKFVPSFPDNGKPVESVRFEINSFKLTETRFHHEHLSFSMHGDDHLMAMTKLPYKVELQLKGKIDTKKFFDLF